MKNHYTLNPGEFFAAQEILKHRSDLGLCIPMKDHGWDLLAVKQDGSAPVRIQVKESRVYVKEKENRIVSWHQLREDKLADADVFVFVSYIPVVDKKKTSFTQDYIVIPHQKLSDLCRKKKPTKGKYHFYFGKENGDFFEFRDGKLPVSEYHRAWKYI